MTDSSHAVLLYQEAVGVLSIRGSVTTFEFLESYVDDPRRPVLGQMFEEEPRGRWRQSQRLPAWFSNLLPEDGPLLDFIASQLEISSRSEARLLIALGADLPGALSIDTDTAVAVPSRLTRFERSAKEAQEGTSEPAIRFSVAGVQLKLSMVSERNSLRLAGKGELGGHYVKFPGQYPLIPENEFAMMTAARACGVDVPEIDLVVGEQLGDLPKSWDRFRRAKVYVIKRFDRTDHGPVHIEDMNQVLGNWPDKKYEGASYESLGRLILAICGSEDFLEFVRRLTFNIAIGNEDAHLKNWSLIYPDRTQARLSPAYDLVSTIQFADLVREMALRLGGKRDVEAVNLAMFRRLATKAGFDPAIVEDVVVRTLEALPSAEAAAREQSDLPDEFWTRLLEYRSALHLWREVSGARGQS